MDKIQAFRSKLKLWLWLTISGSTGRLPAVCSLAASNESIYITEEHLNSLQKFSDYFLSGAEDFD
jgi:hypothetical protein